MTMSAEEFHREISWLRRIQRVLATASSTSRLTKIPTISNTEVIPPHISNNLQHMQRTILHLGIGYVNTKIKIKGLPASEQ
jgi:hypothetical protein